MLLRVHAGVDLPFAERCDTHADLFGLVHAVSHRQEQHHQTTGRKPASEERKQPHSAEEPAAVRGTHPHPTFHQLKQAGIV